MDLEKDYIEYVLEFSLAILAASAAYFFDPFKPLTYGTLLLIPLLFGYTAYISKDGFRISSFLGFIALIFIPINYVLGGLSIIISLGNLLVSVFAGGEHFRDFYSSTTLPLLFTGLVLGTSLFFLAQTNPQVEIKVQNRTADLVDSSIEKTVSQTGFIQQVKNGQKRVVGQSSKAAIKLTSAYVLNHSKNLSLRERQRLAQTFSDAEQEIPSRITERISNTNSNSTDVEISDRVSQLIKENMSDKIFLGFIPLVTFSLYGLQPIIGLLTAFSAFMFSRLSEN